MSIPEPTIKHTKIIGEIGINHNGSIEECKRLIMLSKTAGLDYVKIQKRNPDVCVPEEQKSKMRDTPWGRMTYLEYKWKMEFTEEQIKELVEFSNNIGITFFASVWDKDSCDVMKKYNTISKIPSALITDLELCKYARECFDYLIISTGMSTEAEIDACVAACNPDCIMHTNSTYPCPPEELNLRYITHLQQKYPTKEIGYSGHEFGLVTTFAAVTLGATWVERHITWDRTQWGSDHGSSVEPGGVLKLATGIRAVERAVAYPVGERILFPKEFAKMESLRPKK
jgi:N-acetylneuraminate synthase